MQDQHASAPEDTDWEVERLRPDAVVAARPGVSRQLVYHGAPPVEFSDPGEFEALDEWWTPAARRAAGLVPVGVRPRTGARSRARRPRSASVRSSSRSGDSGDDDPHHPEPSALPRPASERVFLCLEVVA